MARKPVSKQPKIQRGISLEKALHDAIQGVALRLGKNWNEIAESALNAAFLSPNALRDMQTSSREPKETTEEEGIF